jgi:hypothetical protein
MATLAQSIIEAAFAASTASDSGKLAVDGEMILHLNRKYQSMHAMMGRYQRANALAKTTLTFAGSPPSAALPTDIIDVVRVELASDGTRVYIVPVEEKDRTYNLASQSCAFRQGNTLVSVGRAGDPVAGTVWNLFHMDAPATLSALSSTLDPRFPVRFEMVLVLDLAIYLSVKDEGRSPAAFQALKAEYQDEYETFKELIGASNTATESARQQVTAGMARNV